MLGLSNKLEASEAIFLGSNHEAARMNPPTNKRREFWISADTVEVRGSVARYAFESRDFDSLLHVREVLPNANDESEAVIEKMREALNQIQINFDKQKDCPDNACEGCNADARLAGDKAREALEFLRAYREKK